ncbi:hypothetical protein IFM89_018519 [Coptis chinensis]|uniref:phosphoribosylaminoimidazole carboxylase n=1 Tax=Coptis chinensis TaxID=261450 RepID=A0A835HWQ6_9MAGN|nr:hypothetical protein IFM89_018519 [Coptis chinensis]
MKDAAKILDSFGVPHEVRIVSAHRTSDLMDTYAASAHKRGIQIIIAGAGGAAHLPGNLIMFNCPSTPLPVIGVPVRASSLDGIDSLLSIVQMPRGVPVATVAINNATNAGLLPVRILGIGDADLLARLGHIIPPENLSSLELMAIDAGLEGCLKHGITKVQVYFDSMIAVSIVNGLTTPPWETSRAADLLAKCVKDSLETLLYFIPPLDEQLTKIIEDTRGTIYSNGSPVLDVLRATEVIESHGKNMYRAKYTSFFSSCRPVEL